MESTQEFTKININHQEAPDSEHNVKEAEKVFGKAHEKAGVFWHALVKWSREKGDYHSLELYAYAKTLSNDPEELFLIGVTASMIVSRTMVDA